MDNLEITQGDITRQLNKFSENSEEFYSNTDNLSPVVSITYFFVISLAYLFLQIFVIVNSTSLVEIDNVKTHKLYLISYCILILLGSFFINFNISKGLCPNDNTNIYVLLLNTIFPWLFIFGSIFCILIVFNTWHRPFSNTIGYFVIKILGIEDYFGNMLKKAMPSDSEDGNEQEKQKKNNLIQAIINMSTNKSIFINELDEEYNLFDDFMEQLKIAEIIKADEETKKNIIEIYKLVVIKNSVGRFVWFFLSGIIISTVTYNNMINSSCNQSKTSILKAYEDIKSASE
tara:strand:+ start:83 stop:946 length:864 start_codon:yes stop_codon:yes gene_type:complete